MKKVIYLLTCFALLSCKNEGVKEKDIDPFKVSAAKRGKANAIKDQMLSDKLSQTAAKLSGGGESKEPSAQKKEPKDLLGLEKSHMLSSLGTGLVHYKPISGSVKALEDVPKVKEPPPPKPVKKNKKYTLTSYQPPAKKVSARPRPMPKRSAPKRKPARDMEMVILASAMSESEEVTGRNPGYVDEGDNLLKLGSEYLAVIKDAEVISRGSKAYVVIDVVGVLSDFASERPYKLYAEMSLNRNETRVDVKVTKCIGVDAHAKSIGCKGVIKGIDGKTGLSGDLYNPAVWGKILSIATKAVAGYSLERMTRTVTQNGVLVDQTQSNAVLTGFADSLIAFGEDQKAEWAKMGATITLPGNSLVKVLITEDTVLWSDARDLVRMPRFAMTGRVGRF